MGDQRRDIKVTFDFEGLTNAEFLELLPLLKAVADFQDQRKLAKAGA